ncbi:hypothetical protein AUC60_09375 [Pseudomonas caspiana]|uniref:Lipoprotein n=2 Tax=Pseudomonas caspiana TaxID=1451454 RepID=A0A1Y3P2H9_9PSED|nr:hypothetical protein AUC60_09375 [Pseudomonas caspiana]
MKLMRVSGGRAVAASLLLSVAVLAGCESTRERLLAQGYPAPYASGFEDGCGSGRQAAGALGEFRKNVPVYLEDRKYATGWDDGFRQCQASTTSDFQRHVGIDSQADRDWQHSKDQAWSRAIRH